MNRSGHTNRPHILTKRFEGGEDMEKEKPRRMSEEETSAEPYFWFQE